MKFNAQRIAQVVESILLPALVAWRQSAHLRFRLVNAACHR
jgi:hypothetical protein